MVALERRRVDVEAESIAVGIARWHGELDEARFHHVLAQPALADPDLAHQDDVAATGDAPAAEPGRRRRAEPVPV